MTLKVYEQKLKSANPNLRLKRGANGLVGLYDGKTFVARVSSGGEIGKYDSWQGELADKPDMATTYNPNGTYRWQRLIARGRISIAQILYAERRIKNSDIAKLS